MVSKWFDLYKHFAQSRLIYMINIITNTDYYFSYHSNVVSGHRIKSSLDNYLINACPIIWDLTSPVNLNNLSTFSKQIIFKYFLSSYRWFFPRGLERLLLRIRARTNKNIISYISRYF